MRIERWLVIVFLLSRRGVRASRYPEGQGGTPGDLGWRKWRSQCSALLGSNASDRLARHASGGTLTMTSWGTSAER